MNKLLLFSCLLLFALGFSASSKAQSTDVTRNLDEYSSHYFIAKKYKDDVAKGLETASKKINSTALEEFQSIDFRGLKLYSSTYGDAILFAKREGDKCQSYIDNFYTVHRILNHKRKNNEFAVKAPHDKVSQDYIMCKSSSSGDKPNINFSFTPLGRLYSVSAVVISDEDQNQIIETFENKLKDKKTVFECYRYNQNKCSNGRVFYESSYINFYLEFDTSKSSFKTFENGQYKYLYEVTINSQYLRDLDIFVLKDVFEGDVQPTQKTRL